MNARLGFLAFAFVAGIAAAFNPCGFAMLPAYMGLYMSTGEDSDDMSFGQLYFSFEGRISRSTYWLKFVLPALLIQTVFLIVDAVATEGLLVSISALVLIWPVMATQAKRWHDRNKSAWWILIGFIPILGSIWAFVELGLLKGTDGENRFGPDPALSHSSSVKRLVRAVVVGGGQ